MNTGYVQYLLNLIHSNNIMVWRPPYLYQTQKKNRVHHKGITMLYWRKPRKTFYLWNNNYMNTKHNNDTNTIIELSVETNLNSAMIFMIIEAERTKSTIHTIQTVHITLTLMRISVHLTLNKETLFQQRFQPWRPSVFFIIRSSSTLWKKSNFESDP